MKKQTGATPMDAALKYLTPRARTVREMERHLDSLNYGEYEVYQVVERLKELGYLDDQRFAEDFVRTRLNTKPVSRRKLREQLLEHQLESLCVQAALETVTDEIELNNAIAVAEKFARQLADLEPEIQKERTLKRLDSRGYCYDTARQAWDQINENQE